VPFADATEERQPAGRVLRAATWLVPDRNPAGTVYGLLAIAALLAAESGLHESYFDTLLSAVIAGTTYWLLHAYSTALGRRLAGGERLNTRTLATALNHERALLRGGAIPMATLVIAWVTGVDLETGVTVALWVSVAALVGVEVLAGIRVKAGRAELALDTAVGLVLGVAVVVLRVVLHH
jgi:hypothetical protein